jgi:CHASE1-domain containing sensor protein
MSAIADALQVLQGIAVLLLLVMAVGAWRAKQEATPANLSREIITCRAACDRRLTEHDHEIEKSRNRHHEITAWQESLPNRLDQSYARKETIGVQLDGISTRLANIERALRIANDEE